MPISSAVRLWSRPPTTARSIATERSAANSAISPSELRAASASGVDSAERSAFARTAEIVASASRCTSRTNRLIVEVDSLVSLQAADFARDDRKTQAVCTGARSFDRGVKRKQLSFVRNVLDELGHRADFAHQTPEIVHRTGGLRRQIGELLDRCQQRLHDFERVTQISASGARVGLRTGQPLDSFARTRGQ